MDVFLAEGACRVVRVAQCCLVARPGAWPFAERNRAAIDRHWSERIRENPAYFNGRIHLLESGTLSEATFEGTFLAADFASFLYWRDNGGDMSAADAFGSALVRSREGHVVLGRQNPGNINAGLAYLPGGFIDARDVRTDGSIDIEASIARELEEETGLAAPELEKMPGMILTVLGRLVSIAVEFRSPLDAEGLVARIRSHIAGEVHPELADVVVVKCLADLDDIATPDHVVPLLRQVLGSA